MLITICALLTMSASTVAQSILDAKQLAYAKAHLKDAAYSQAFRNLVSLADDDLLLKPPTVMTKEYIPASGSKHDYVSLARYAWPDETQPNGLPYVMRDGVSNPELKNLIVINFLPWRMQYTVCLWLITFLEKKNMPKRQPNL